MKKLLLFTFCIVTLLSCGNAKTESTDEETTKEVFICTGVSAKRYHSSPECLGLKRCSAEVESITKEEAESEDKTPCKMCYKE